jgi:TnpA family transposase
MSDLSLDDLDGDSLPQSGDRLQILSPEEYELLWGFPRFTQSDRDLFFTLTAPEREVLEQRRSVRTKIHFLLHLGYFRARQRFFRFELPAVRDDVDYLRRRYFDNQAVVDLTVSDHTRKRHVETLLRLFRYRLCALDERLMLEAHARQAARISSRPVYVLRELVDLLRRERVVLPGYTILQNMVRGALAFERKRLAGALEGLIEAEDAKSLDRLLADDAGLHQITTIKRQPRDFSYQQLLTEIERGQQLRGLFALSERIIARLDLSGEGVRYYASLVEYYTVYKLKRMDREAVHLYLLCFIHDRYQRLNDNLLGAFCSLVRRYVDEVGVATKEAVYRFKLQTGEDVEQGAKVLALFLDSSIDGRTPFATVREQAHALLAPERLHQLCRHLTSDGSLDEGAFEWKEVDRVMAKVKRNLRPLLRFLLLQGTSANATLLETLAAMIDAFELGEPLPALAVSTALIPARSKRYVLDPAGTIIRDRYEFMVYRQLRDGLEAGDLHCRDSARFRSFDDDLVDDATFDRRAELLPRHGLEVAARPIREQLEALRDLVEERFESVNRRILAGENAFVRVQDGRTVWERAVRSEEPLPSEPFFDMVERVDVDTLLLFVDRRNGFMEAFEHVLGRYRKTAPSKPAIVASLMAYATNIGLGRMADISNLSFQELSTAAGNFIRLETLKEANDRIANATARLPIFRHFDIDEAVHSSSDGQKFESAIPTINARHSSKYFGLHKGVVAYTLLANHVPLNARIIGANEHESHFVFDILFNNATDILPAIHSTDTHGTNHVNFALLHLFGYCFAPRYRKVRSKVETGLYGFRHPGHYNKDWPIKPIRRAREGLIVSEWPNIERILLSLVLKTTTQSVIVGKLSAYRRKNRTKRALWEFDNIIRSLYLLDYIDSPVLRRNVQRALNRGEAYHQLRRSIAYAHGGRFRARSQHEQEIWNECSRLVGNAVVYYNALILSEALAELESRGELASAEVLKRVSPVAWQHINFYGRYQFDADFTPIDLNRLRQQLSSEEVSRLYATADR